MKKFVLFFLFVFLYQVKLLDCRDVVIQNCESTTKEEDQDICIKCKDRHFLFFHNLYCIACNDPYYGQIGCEGNCNGSRYQQDRIAYCNPNECKEGYYYLNGICFNCTIGSPGCKTCNVTETKINNQIDYSYQCQECLSNEYKLDEFGICQKCEMPYCQKCHYNDNYSGKECDQCDGGYYISSDKTCKRCKEYIYIENGYCRVCSDNDTDYEKSTCYCYSHSVLNPNKTCSYCGNGCNNCILKEDKTPYCLSCNSGTFEEENKCLICSGGCSTCYLDNNKQEKCRSCYSGYALSSNETCEFCTSGCNNCIIDTNNKPTCLSCSYHYAFNLNKTCTYCGDIDYIGGYGCERCTINSSTKKYECLQCRQLYYDSKYHYDYAYINNKYQCLSNTNYSDFYLYGCLEANYISDNKYECLKCKEDFIFVVNDKNCRKLSEINLDDFCLELINLGNETNPLYSCSKCHNEKVRITNKNNISDCYDRTDNLVYCIEGEKDDNSNLNCTKCVQNAHLNNKCECDYDSFGYRDLFCYKCDDINHGNPGCVSSEGCIYKSSNDQLDCNQCKSDFFNYTKGQCFSCLGEIEYCNKCQADSNVNLICENCLEHFSLNREQNYCELNCQEYPEIAPGCLICNEKYLSEKKCQICKPGYFKTKDESCVYCRSEKNGGPACNKCEYEKDVNGKAIGNIKCANCNQSFQVLNSKGQCYNCKIDLFNECERCKFVNKGSNEKLVCTLCKSGYYLDSEGNCINLLKYLEKIPYCEDYRYDIRNITIYYYFYNENQYYLYFRIYYNNSYYSFYYYDLDEYDEDLINYINNNLKEINSTINGNCTYCKSGYYLNTEGKCVEIKLENCSINYMIQNYNEYRCKEFCRNNRFPLVILVLNNTVNGSNYLTVSEIYDKYRYTFNIYGLNSIMNKTLCIDNSEKDFEGLKNCISVLYIQKEDKYMCYECFQGYILDKETNNCKKKEDLLNCEYENIGTEKDPIYSCTKCKNYYYYDFDYIYYDNYFYNYIYNYSLIEESEDDYYSNYIMVKEDNVKFCVQKYEYGIENCLEADADTTYVKTKYDCSSCTQNYLPYKSKFFGRYICQNIYQNIIKNKTFIFENNLDVEKTPAINGGCEKKNLFTPDGENCYECNNKFFGMPGCKGECSFSLERNDVIKCETDCKEGYIESSEGVCELCNNVNQGCYQCHYEEEYPNNYIGIKRKRRFVCDFCEDDYIKKNEECLHCSYFINGCEKCEFLNNDLKCKKCFFDYYLTDEGICNYCGENNQFIKDSKCIQCNDTKNGGIEGCQYCEINSTKTFCRLCQEGYILLSNDNTCLKISENKELELFDKCEQITLDKKNEIHCSRCKNHELTLLKENSGEKCTYLPTLSADYDRDYYNRLKYDILIYDVDYIYDYYYYNNIYIRFSPCLEAINLGTEEKPLYSCSKCYNIYELNKIYNNEYTLIEEEKTNISYCIYSYYVYSLQNCSEAKLKIKGRTIKYSCAKCLKDNNLVYNSYDDINYCQPQNSTSKCMVKYCQICKSEDNYFCQSCLVSGYIVNRLTGSCMKETENIPAITWKDIFRLQLNSEKEINGRTIHGPTLRLRGITNSQINTGHAFLIYLIFKLKQDTFFRNLEETVKLEAICEIIDGVEETKNDTNIVDYECIAENKDNKQISELINIEEGNNNDMIKKSNLMDLVSQKNLSNLDNISQFKLEDLMKIVTFTMNGIKNQTANNNIFDFKIDGEINKNISSDKIIGELQMNEFQDLKSNCTFNIEEQQKANLNCNLNVEKYKEQKIFTFRTSELSNENLTVTLADLDKIFLINDREDSFNSTMITKRIINKSSKKKKTAVIVVSIIASLIVVIAAVFLTYFYLLAKKNANAPLQNLNTIQNSSDNINNSAKNNKTSENINI